MTDQLTATIIPFPIRSRVASAPAGPAPARLPATPPHVRANALASSSQRLSQALANLSSALADQKDATQRWKSAIEDLATKMRTISDLDAQKKIS